MMAKPLWWGCAVLLVVGAAWSAQRFWESREFQEGLELAEKFYLSCVAERRRSEQAYYLCREWSYGHIAATSSGATRKKLRDLSAAAAIQSLELCQADLKARQEQLRQLEIEMRGQDGLLHSRSAGDMKLLLELRKAIGSIGIDCRSLDFDIQSMARSPKD